MRVDLPGGLRLHGWQLAVVPALAIVTVLAMGLGLFGLLPGQGETSAAVVTSRPAITSSSPTASPNETAPAPAPAPVLAPVGASAPLPTSAGLDAALSWLLARPDLGRHVGGAVVDVATGRLLYGSAAGNAFAPASTTKLLTATAALAVLGPNFRIQTKVVAGSTPGQVVLVGGGDPTLSTAAPAGFVPAPASLADLAGETAAALHAAGITTVTLGYDTTLFAGPRVAQTWPPTDITTGVVSPVTALSLDEGRVGEMVEGPAARVVDPPLSAAKAFERRLVALGIKVSGQPAPARAPRAPAASASPTSASSADSPASAAPSANPPTAGTTLAVVQSPALSDLVAWMLSTSDNDLAEAVAHLTALHAGQPPTFAGGVAAVTKSLQALGLGLAQVRLYDGSGLTGSTQASPALLGSVLSLAASPDHPTLRPLLTGLAVAGFSGSMTTRFSDAATRAAAGLVRVKSGTLSVVSALAGTVLDADGRELAFVFLADQVPIGGTPAAREALDRLATAVAGCGCR